MDCNQTIYLEPDKPPRESSYAIINAIQEARAAIDRALALVG